MKAAQFCTNRLTVEGLPSFAGSLPTYPHACRTSCPPPVPAILAYLTGLIESSSSQTLMCIESPGELPGPLPECLIQWVQSGAQEFPFLPSSQMLLLLIQGPHFENHSSEGICCLIDKARKRFCVQVNAKGAVEAIGFLLRNPDLCYSDGWT